MNVVKKVYEVSTDVYFQQSIVKQVGWTSLIGGCVFLLYLIVFVSLSFPYPIEVSAVLSVGSVIGLIASVYLATT